MTDADSHRVLIVDDDPAALALLEGHLSVAGYHVLRAENGVEAMRILQSEGASIVITDWVMPEMDGLELCRAIRTRESIPFAFVIIVTAQQTSDDHLVEAFDAGADDYVCKPYKPKELLARVRAGERIVSLQQKLESRNLEVHRYNAEAEIVNAKLATANKELNRMATSDELTGLINRREALTRLADMWEAMRRYGHPLSCIALDIDRFKSCNDAFGHDIGDVVLKETTRVLQVSTRRDEPVCRVGGEEFLILCSGSSEALAAIGAERLRRAVEANVIHCGELTLRVTISLGVAQRTSEMKSPDDLLRASDDALYAAKDAGRNTVCLASAAEKEPQTCCSQHEYSATLMKMETDEETPEAAPKVLVVDDDPSTRTLCRRFLERDGYQINEAVDGADALRKVQQDPPDVIIMDAVMPNIDGLECTRKLKASPETKGIPVIIVSARTDAADILDALQAGADEHLTKPLHPEELVLRVKTMVRLGRELGLSNEVRGEQSWALGLLLDFSCDIAAAESLDDVLEWTLTVAAGLTCCRRVSIMLPDADNKSLTVARCLGIESYRCETIRVPIGTMISGRVFESRESIVVSTLSEARQRGSDPDAMLLSSVPSVSTLLCASERAVGVLNITGRQGGRPFTTLELDYLDLVCNIAASAIDERLTRRGRDEARHSIVVALVKLAEYRDSDTGKHVDRVTRFCCLLAKALRPTERYRAIITDEFLADLERAMPLHDIGKVAIPDRILLKPGRLDNAERAIMQTHAAIGAKTIQSVIERVPGARLLIMAEEITHAHHEWFDGGGYPRGLVGEAIPVAARIAAVADAYDAMTTKLVYKDAMSHERAVAIITQASGTQFAPDVVDAFLECEEEFMRLAAELADDVASAHAVPNQADHIPPNAALVGAS